MSPSHKVPDKPWTEYTRTSKEYELINHKKSLQIAADRIDRMLWIGILEDMNKSMELLEHQLNIEFNNNKKKQNLRK